jgi:phospholipase C
LLFVLGAALAPAQTIPVGTFKHIIIVVQENRTPDNLFGATPVGHISGCSAENGFEPGVDIVDGGTPSGMQLQCSIPLPMNDGSLNPQHGYKLGWLPQYDNGNMDGFCQIKNSAGQCLQYSYVQKSDVQPYFDIATSYGFANYFFQTNEGPSFPAHQFLFTGTSAPVAPPNNTYLNFVAENGGNKLAPSGCDDNSSKAQWVDPTGTEGPGPFECYTHDSLVTNASGDKGVSWRYYTPALGVIWDAPEAIPEVCYGQNNLNHQFQPCTASEFTSHVVLPNKNGYDGAPILDDIASCSLQQISWVIPDEIWSDHPSFDTHVPPLGPSWVANIVNAVGNSWTNSNGKCDYWGYPAHAGTTPEPTLILVVWDDWGGWFDHVKPPEALRQNAGAGFTNCPDPTKQWGCGNVYGFRVPFLVVSEYTKAGYVSGALPSPGKVPPYEHDFGSILAFTEYNFGMPNIDQSGDKGYADLNALDSANGNIPLSDFFSLSNQRTFTSIPVVYQPDFYEDYYVNNTTYSPTGPDGDDAD